MAETAVREINDKYLCLERYYMVTTDIEKFSGFSQYNNTTNDNDDKLESFIVRMF